jgi:hypothetical protein
MAKKNRELQRVPPKVAQRQALRARMKPGGFRPVVSGDALYGTLRAQLKHIKEADALAPKSRGPKPKRETLLRILAELEAADLPLRTNAASPVVKHLTLKLHLNKWHVRDLLHQLADMAEKLKPF